MLFTTQRLLCMTLLFSSIDGQSLYKETGCSNVMDSTTDITRILQRLEVKIQTLETTELDLMKKVQILENEKRELTKKVRTLENETNQLDVRVQGQEYLNKQLLTELNSTNTNIADGKRRVGFTTSIKSSDSTWNESVLIFPHVIYASGSGYNPSSGIFTSPTEGDFVFFLSILSFLNQTLYLDIKMNGVSKVRALAISGHWATGSNLVFLHLTEGDKIWVERFHGTGYGSESVPQMTFSGFML